MLTSVQDKPGSATSFMADASAAVSEEQVRGFPREACRFRQNDSLLRPKAKAFVDNHVVSCCVYSGVEVMPTNPNCIIFKWSSCRFYPYFKLVICPFQWHGIALIVCYSLLKRSYRKQLFVISGKDNLFFTGLVFSLGG